MSAGCRRLLPTLLALTLLPSSAPVLAADRDPLSDARARLAIEAQRVEKEFAEGRLAAYKLVRRAAPRLVDSLAQLHTLLAMLQADTSLEPTRRKTLIVTIEADLERVKKIAAERSRLARAEEARAIAREARDRGYEDRRGFARDAESIRASRARAVADARGDRGRFSDRFTGTMSSVARSASDLPPRDYNLPENWLELSKRRSTEMKMTAKERAILAALNKPISVDFTNNTFREIKEYLEKKLGVTIAVDPQGLKDANADYTESTVTLKMRSSTRFVLRRMLADLGLAYIIKDEAIQITSIGRARETTTVRTYYIGDLASVVGVNMPPFMAQFQMIQNINNIINLITSTIDPQSWRVNNPDAPGTIVFDPIRMTLIIKQTAEMHYEMSKSFGR
jgi:hypothetical protein